MSDWGWPISVCRLQLRKRLHVCAWAVSVLLFGLLAPRVQAADVQARLSVEETYVGVPVTLEVVIQGSENAEPPTAPNVPGALIRFAGGPNQSFFMSQSPSGRTQTVTTSYTYQVVPQQAGKLIIPPITVN